MPNPNDVFLAGRPPHPNEVILNGRLKLKGSPMLQAMLADFKGMTQEQQIEFLFWTVQDLAVYNYGLSQQVAHWTQMLKQLSDDGKATVNE